MRRRAIASLMLPAVLLVGCTTRAPTPAGAVLITLGADGAPCCRMRLFRPARGRPAEGTFRCLGLAPEGSPHGDCGCPETCVCWRLAERFSSTVDTILDSLLED